ncbi:MAG TPA: VCBS repeat-containing protein, partial [Pseudonocardia sp.]|nr:VCBS repeat-containing protein [Pseudonocardia sp.]
MKTTARWLRRQLAGIVALLLIVGLYSVSRLPDTPEGDRAELAAGFAFSARSIELPGGFPQQEIRQVNQDYRHIDAWISSVGAGIAMNDLDGDGLANDLCVTDPRTDQVMIAPAPVAGESRYESFALGSGGLPVDDVTAPMGCAPGDFNEDGRMDLLVYYWGRTPTLHLADPAATGLSAAAYRATELVPSGSGGEYTGPQWNTNSVAVADFDGDGHVDIYVGNYFPHGPVLDPDVAGGVAMNDSLSNASNGGEDYFFRWTGTTPGDRP